MRLILITLSFLFSAEIFAQNRITTKILTLKNATAADTARIKAAFKYIESVVNKTDFRSKVLNMTYKMGNKTYSGYTQTTDTPQEILDTILQADENFSGGTSGVMDMFLEMYYEYNGAVGYTYANDPYVYMNRWVQSSYTPMETAGNLFHEWLHKLGHTHSYEWTQDRADSVPYKIGYLIRDMAAQEASKGDPVLKEMMKKSFEGRAFDECAHH